jgi:hypothetical protein
VANDKQTVLIDEDGTRYVMGDELVNGVEIPCKMPIVNGCPVCLFEWPDVLTPPEVKAMKQGKGCPECKEGETLVNDQFGNVRYMTV